jgi:hypothetical protein
LEEKDRPLKRSKLFDDAPSEFNSPSLNTGGGTGEDSQPHRFNGPTERSKMFILGVDLATLVAPHLEAIDGGEAIEIMTPFSTDCESRQGSPLLIRDLPPSPDVREFAADWPS